MENWELAYAAGIIDGEGSISVLRRLRPKLEKVYHYCLQVQVSQKEKPILNWLAMRFGGKVNGYTQYKGSLGYGNPIYHWQIFGETARDFLVAIEPYLIKTKFQASIAKNYPVNRTKNHLSEDDYAYQEYAYKAMKGEF